MADKRVEAASSDRPVDAARETNEHPRRFVFSLSKQKLDRLSAIARAHEASRDWSQAAEAWAGILAYRSYTPKATAKITARYSRALRYAGRAEQAHMAG